MVIACGLRTTERTTTMATTRLRGSAIQNVSTRHIAKYLSMVRSNITSARSGNSLTPQNAIGESSILMDMCMREMSQKLPL